MPETTGQRIKALRTKQGLTQKNLAILLKQETHGQVDVGVSFLSQIESGSKAPSTDMVGALAGVLGTSADYLLLRVDDPAPPANGDGLLVAASTPQELRVLRAIIDEVQAVDPNDQEMIADVVRLFARAIARRNKQ